MENKYFLAVDIGASSGRHILGSIVNGKLELEEIYRFKNGAINKGENLIWDHNSLLSSIIEGLKKCKQIGKIPCSMGIDTWGVDYALLDENDSLINEVYCYRDKRTLSVIDEVHSIISEEELYNRTGIQKQVYNTIFQLYCDKKSGKLKNAKSFLMTPDYLNFLLTGVKKNEYTICSTSGLINVHTHDWDYDIIEKLGFDKALFNSPSLPQTKVGSIKEEIADKVGFSVDVYLPATHDTASAVMAVPLSDMPLYISSGTWSLMGVETPNNNTSNTARECGFTNEGGYNKSVRFLKNIMGLWMIQNIKKEYNDKYSFSDFVVEARKVKDFNSVVEVNDLSFFSPKSMIDAVKDYCKNTNQQVPESVGEIVYCVYNSLAQSYAKSVEQIEQLIGKTFSTINIVGGGCQNELLNELTAKASKRKVMAGPIEATAIGNITAQMLGAKVVETLADAKDIIKNSFDVKEYN